MIVTVGEVYGAIDRIDYPQRGGNLRDAAQVWRRLFRDNLMLRELLLDRRTD